MKRFAVILSIALALPALAASYSSGSKSSGSSRSYSSGSSSKSYSSGSKYSSGSSGSSYSKPSSPPKSYSSPSSSAAKAMKVQESQRSYSSYQQKVAPPTSAPSRYTGGYSTRSYSTRYSDPDYWSKRKDRERRVFGSQPQTTVVHNYSDGISPMFWGFMMGQSINNQAAWAYHHRDSMDDARYRELLAKDVALEAKVKAMEAEGIKRDPNYLPEGVDEDLVYSKPKQPESQVSSPQPQEVITAPEKEDGTGFFTWLLILTGIGCAGYAAYYFGFKKKYSL